MITSVFLSPAERLKLFSISFRKLLHSESVLMTEFNKGKRCFLSDIERCTAPCINNDKALYDSELEKVYDFLYGKKQYALTRLLNKMKDYSDKQKYEKAAETKAVIDLILTQTHKSSLIAEPVNSANVLFEIDEGFGRDYILMLKGKLYLKKYSGKGRNYFEDALDDYFEGTLKPFRSSG
jgi:DNA polymerase III subunit epsilon